jgi:translation initiation factor IF-3
MIEDTPDPEYRNYKMPPDELNRIPSGDSNKAPSKQKQAVILVNGRIKAREVRVISEQGSQIGVMPLTDALALAKSAKLDLVQITYDTEPPVCRILDFGKYRFELAKLVKKSV